MKPLIFAAVIGVCAAGPASAGYLGDRAAWDRLPEGAKIAYAMGAYDASNVLFGADDKETVALKQARVRCLAEQRFPPTQLAGLVDAAYAASASRASLPPSTLLIGQVSARCAGQINEERAKLGLSPLKLEGDPGR